MAKLEVVAPDLTEYPRWMSARRARYEKKRALGLRRRLPNGHPYALAPSWTPYAVAILIGWMHAAVTLGRR